MSSIQDLAARLKTQLAELTEEIRITENNLMTAKEGYLKVSGALEILDILKKEEAEEERAALSSAGMAD
jgi:DNA-binding Xre family transcriptional regulator